MSGKRVAIIGAGVGGLTTAIHLAREGFSVEVFERNSLAGGRCGAFEKDGHHFDIGATLLMMTDIYVRTWQSFGKDLFQELDLIRMEPIYRINFDDGEQIDFSSDLSKIQSQLESVESGSFEKMLDYLSESYQVYRLSMKHIIDRNFNKPLEFFNLKNLLLLLRLNAFKNHYRQASKYFKSEPLRTTFTFQNIYVGQNPFQASAIFSMLPFLELTDGVWYPRGGMTKITDNLLSIAKENGVSVHLNSGVGKIRTNRNKTEGIALDDGHQIDADLVVCNADVPYAYDQLLPDPGKARQIKNKDHTCSAMIFHWGLDKTFPQFEQHNVYVAGDYEKNLEAVFEKQELLDDTSFYVHAPARSDSSAAPANQDSISLLVPVNHLDSKKEQDWNVLRKRAKTAALTRLKKEGIPDLEEHIKFEVVYNPKTWQNRFHVSKGSVFGSLSHKLMQMGYMRPHNQHKKYRNLFFVGGSTHPGNGIPMVLLSAKHVTENILKYANNHQR
jgi:phytoene desaturase